MCQFPKSLFKLQLSNWMWLSIKEDRMVDYLEGIKTLKLNYEEGIT